MGEYFVIKHNVGNQPTGELQLKMLYLLRNVAYNYCFNFNFPSEG